MKKINPESLKTNRKRRGLTQKALAERCGCTFDQISRWERGTTQMLRTHSQERLTSALGVSWEVLERAPDVEDEYNPWLDVPYMVQLNHRVRGTVRTALDIVSRRYGVRPAEIIELSPLLFLITAEQSLLRRQKNIDAIAENLDRATREAQSAAPHLAHGIYPKWENDEVIAQEQKSINDRDVFCAHIEIESPNDEDVEDHDAYTTHLKSLAEDLPSGLVDEISPEYGRAPTYTIAWNILRRVTGLSAGSENEDVLLNFVWDGHISLNAIFSQRKSMNEEELVRWISDQYELYQAKEKAKLAAWLNGQPSGGTE